MLYSANIVCLLVSAVCRLSSAKRWVGRIRSTLYPYKPAACLTTAILPHHSACRGGWCECPPSRTSNSSPGL